MQSLKLLMDDYCKENRHERLGQYFCNRYIKQPWPELFHETDTPTAANMIEEWLANNQYTDTMPQKIGDL